VGPAPSGGYGCGGVAVAARAAAVAAAVAPVICPHPGLGQQVSSTTTHPPCPRAGG
jgi:hypothetical protein